ncbi:hypothetical protein BpHYR1_040509 [Brachionus plicatilis]|uniref:Uncharacterized protein n=1 Tax=Brachionus plicatilis TaxID=10195 RepID=A0A3M7T0X7_BRAPC|nr:hypothetical protein BpHYR1_040509 [Brachionus plicatilis]
MDRMPTSNGINRSNYTTSTNFSVVTSSYVFIPDQRLREIVQKLVNSEQDRIANTIDPNLITQINHRGYSLFFSRTGVNPFQQQHQQDQNNTLELNSSNQATSENEPKENSQNNQKVEPIEIPSEASTARNNVVTMTQVSDQQNSVYTERAPTMVFNQSVPMQDEIPPEVNRAIQQDLATNPLYGAERSYKIVLNNKMPGEEPRVVKVIAKSPNYQQLPQIQPRYIIQQKPQYVQQWFQMLRIKIVQIKMIALIVRTLARDLFDGHIGDHRLSCLKKHFFPLNI